jgi:hypothetical protein
MAEVYKGVHHIQEADGYVSVDSTYFPIVTMWWGGLISERLFDRLWDYRNEVLTCHVPELAPLVVLVHTIDDIKPMDAKLRKYLADKGENDPVIQAKRVTSIVLVTSPVMRGVMTAVKWIAGEKFPLEITGNFETGFKFARKLLEERNHMNAVIPEGYEFPRNPNAKLSK